MKKHVFFSTKGLLSALNTQSPYTHTHAYAYITWETHFMLEWDLLHTLHRFLAYSHKTTEFQFQFRFTRSFFFPAYSLLHWRLLLYGTSLAAMPFLCAVKVEHETRGEKRRKSQCNRVNAKLINCEIFRIVMDWIWIFWCIYTCAQF